MTVNQIINCRQLKAEVAEIFLRLAQMDYQIAQKNVEVPRNLRAYWGQV
jgi:hypothetical protein